MPKEFVRGDHFVQFGDGTTSQIIDLRYYKAPDGQTMAKFLLCPSDEQKEDYNLVEGEDLDKVTGWCIKEYRKVDVWELKRTATKTRVWVFTSFDNEQTLVSMADSDHTERIASQDKLINTYKIENERLHEELRMAKTQNLMDLKQNVEAIKIAASARGQLRDEESDMDQPPGEGGY